MVEEKNEKWRQIFYSRWFLLGMIFLSIILTSSYIRAYYQEYLVKQEIKNLQQEVRNLEAKKIETMEIFKYVQSDSFVEEKARTELNLLKSGEKMALISNSSVGNINGQMPDKVVKWSSIENPIKWLKFFFFKNNN
jgi:cell division protein FtsB